MIYKRKIITTVFIFLIVLLVFMTGCSLFEGLGEIIEEASNSPVPSINPTKTPVPSTSPSATPQPTPTVTPTPTPTPAPVKNPAEDMNELNSLKEYIERYFNQFEGRYGITFLDIASGNSFDIDAYDQYIAASTSKLPINLYLFKMIDEGVFDFDIEMKYLEEDLEYGTGKIIHGEYGDTYTVAQLIQYSLVYSDNCAINMIIRLCGKENILTYMADLGATINYGPRHRSCPADMAVFTKELYDKYIENPDLYGIMINYLENTIFNDRLNLYLPADVPVAHKIGNYVEENAYNDVGIIFADTPYIVSIMSEQTNENLEAFEVLAQTSLMIYRFMEGIDYKTVMNPVVQAMPEAFSFEYDVVNPEGYDFNELISFGKPDQYQEVNGVLTFRGNNYRNGGAYGSADIKEGDLEVIWSFDVGVIDNWPGTGWTGQPSIIEWPVKTVELMNVYPQFKRKLTEGSSLCRYGWIYIFLPIGNRRMDKTAN